MKKWLIKFALLFFGIIIAFFFLEISSRIFWKKLSKLDNFSSISFVAKKDYSNVNWHKRNSKFIWVGKIGNIKEFYVKSKWNRLGYHDKDYPFEKPDGTFRIIVLGDSFVEAVQVPLENTFHKILEKKLNESMPFTVEVIALGGSGRGARRNYEILKNIGIKFNPDFVILGFLSNDPIDDSPVLTKELMAQQKLREKYIPSLSEIYYRFLFLRNSRFNQLLALKMAKVYQNLKIAKYASIDKYGFIPFNTLIFVDNYSPAWKRAWRTTEKFILKSKNLSKKVNAEFLLISFPEAWRIQSISQIKKKIKNTSPKAKNYKWNFNKTEQILRNFCRKNHIHFLSLLPSFKEEYLKTKKNLHYAYDMHLNKAGHKVAAQAIYNYLLQNNLIKEKDNEDF